MTISISVTHARLAIQTHQLMLDINIQSAPLTPIMELRFQLHQEAEDAEVKVHWAVWQLLGRHPNLIDVECRKLLIWVVVETGSASLACPFTSSRNIEEGVPSSD